MALRKITRPTGFTLLELMVVLTIVGVLASLALPSFNEFIGNQRIKNASFDLVSSLIFARSEAVKRNGNINMNRTGGTWAGGWTISSGATSLRVQNAYSGLAISDSASLTAVTFGNNGRLTTASVTSFTVAPSPSQSGVKCRSVAISLSGVPQSKVVTCP